MEKEIKTVVYDEELRMEAYCFEGTRQPFPNHFHDYYVIGFVVEGERGLSCRHREYTLRRGNIVLFHPGDNHACAQTDGGSFHYRGLHISKEVMFELAEEVTGRRELPGFSENVICDDEVLCYLRPLHESIMKGDSGFGKEENLLLLLSSLMQHYGKPFESCIPECSAEIEKACRFMEEHLAERICLEQICRETGLSKSTLLRAFTKSKGITPYRYLETVRINEAKKLLADGVSVLDTAIRTGFSDQSHLQIILPVLSGLRRGYIGRYSERKVRRT